MINSGEINEALVKLRLIELRDLKQSVLLNGIQTLISSVGFRGVDFASLPNNTNLQNVYTLAYKGDLDQLTQLINTTGTNKAGAKDKADVYINGIGYSVKSLQEAPPALVNHTPRFGWLRICNQLGISIDELDMIIDEYWDKRKHGIISEDIPNSHPESPFKNHKDYFRPLLNYFLFEGTGSSSSPSPAKYILDFTNPIDTTTWTTHGIEYIDSHWNDLIFSVRHKGFEAYPNKDVNKRTINARWAQLFQGSYKGSLHVRFRGGK